MQFKTNSWHYKLWVRSFSISYPPQTTDLCRYCHRVFWQLFWWGFMGLWALLAVSVLGYALFYMALWQHTRATLIGAGAMAAVIGILYLYARWLVGKKKEPTTLAGKWVQARKEKVCPMVSFSDE